MNIEQRIQKLKAELHDHTRHHDAMVAEHDRNEKIFQANLTLSQARYQQISGAIAELELMLQESAKENGESEPAKPIKIRR